MNKPVLPDSLDEPLASTEKRMQELVADPQRVARAMNKAIADARKHADHLRKTIPTLPLPKGDRYLRENPPSALALMILMRETPSSKGGHAKKMRYTAARLFAEDYWRLHCGEIETESKVSHARYLAKVINDSSDFPCTVKDRTVLEWWKTQSE